MRFRKLALLFLLLGFGAAVETAYTLKTRMAIGPTGCRVLTGRFQGPAYTFESEESRDVPAGLSLAVENAFGEVRVWKGEPGKLKLRVRKVVFLPTEEQAKDWASRIRPTAALSGQQMRVTTNRRELELASDVGFETHLAIEVPPDTVVNVQNEHGAANVSDAKEAKVWSSYDAVHVSRIAGAADVSSRHGDVGAESVGGTLTVAARYGNVEVKDVAQTATLTVEHGDARVEGVGSLKATLLYGDLQAEQIRGDFEVQGRHAAVKASDVKGRTLIDTTYRNVELQKLGADARVKTEHGAVTASDLAGALSAEVTYDDVLANRVAGPVEVHAAHGGFRGNDLRQGARVQTSGDDVSLQGFEGPVQIEAQRGGVHLDPRKPIQDSLSVVTVRGGIRLSVPPGSRFELEASAQRGDVQVNVDNLTISESSSSRLKAHLGKGGQSVTLRTEHGDINVESRSSTASTQH